MKPMWRIELLGHFQISGAARRGERIQLAKKGEALLAYLALNRGYVSRDVLAALFWPESETARKSLSMALNELRTKLNDDSLLTLTRDAARLNPDAFTTDAAEFEAALHAAARAKTDSERIAALESAIALYRGPFLPARVGLNPCFAPDWIRERQNRLAALCYQALRQIIELLETAGRSQDALRYALLAAEHAPQDEPFAQEARKQVLRLSNVVEKTAEAPKKPAPELRVVAAASLDSLSDSSRLLLSRLSVFSGGWTDAMAAEVLGAARDPAALRKLQAACLIVPVEPSDPPRRTIAAAVRESAFARLSGRERSRLSLAHARCVCGVASAAGETFLPSDAPAYLARMDAECANLDAALRWTLREGRDPALGAQLLGAFRSHFYEVNQRGVLREWLELALTHRDALLCEEVYFLYSHLGHACLADYDHAAAFAAFEQASRHAITVGKTAEVASAFDALGIAAHHAGKDAQARAAFEAGLAALPEESRFEENRGYLLSNFAVALAVQNEPKRARALLEESLLLAKRAGGVALQALNCYRLAELLLDQNEAGRARRYANESLELWQSQTETRRLETADCLRLLGAIHLAQEHYAEARHLLRESAAIFAEFGRAECRAAALGLLGDVDYRQGRMEAAASLYEEGLTIWERAAHPRWQAFFSAASGAGRLPKTRLCADFGPLRGDSYPVRSNQRRENTRRRAALAGAAAETPPAVSSESEPKKNVRQ